MPLYKVQKEDGGGEGREVHNRRPGIEDIMTFSLSCADTFTFSSMCQHTRIRKFLFLEVIHYRHTANIQVQ